MIIIIWPINQEYCSIVISLLKKRANWLSDMIWFLYGISLTNSKDYTDQLATLIKTNFQKQSIKSNFDTYANGYNLEDMLVSCFFEGTTCNTTQFYYYSDLNYGNCFSFNLGQVNNAGLSSVSSVSSILAANFPGLAKGLQLEMYAGSPVNQMYSYNNGIRVTVHNQSIVAIPLDDGLNVPTGM